MSGPPNFAFEPPRTDPCDGAASCADLRVHVHLWIEHGNLSSADRPVLDYASAWARARDARRDADGAEVRGADGTVCCTLERDGDRVRVRSGERTGAFDLAGLDAFVERVAQRACSLLYALHPHLVDDPSLLAFREDLGIGPPRVAPVADADLRALAEATLMQPYPYAVDWEAVRAATGFGVPADYRALVERFGPGAFDYYLHVLAPGAELDAHDSAKRALWWDEYLAEYWEQSPKDLPERLRGKAFTILNWGVTEDGAHLFWIAEEGVAPERWPVAIHTTEGQRWEFYEESTTAVLAALAHGESPTDLIPAFDVTAIYHPLW
ncbi:hypothetical protein [Glycomyces paridis]|uniref:SMI1/KNR4 family protein n=1 Tax=Glycomyces paridis TaxID=2126555 RepID=A0A4S8PHT7_9ACTN|nr:hypothetical protein [Glycomyces paridis]THV30163.1 hypothetical protein E9998_07270 [Glycomyces paridis]